MPLCVTQYTDESETAVSSVSPGSVPLGGCVGGCCPRTVRLQIRTRYAYGAAKLCAPFPADFDPDPLTASYKTQQTITQLYRNYVDGEQVSSCTRTEVDVAADAAIKSWSDPAASVDCGGEPIDISWSPTGCDEDLNQGDVTSIPDAPESTLSGASGTRQSTRDAALAAMTWGAWSEWTDFLVINVDSGTPEAGGFSHALAENGAGDNGMSAFPYTATASRYESELRIVGGSFSLHLAVSEGTGAVESMAVNRYTLEEGTPQVFSVDAPVFDAPVSSKVLRCVCSLKYAPES